MKIKCKLTPENIEEIVRLFKEGFSQNHIAHEFSIDHSTVYYHLKKRKLLHKSHKIRITLGNKKDLSLTDEFGDRICRGKSYDEYLDAEEIKRLQRQEDCSHSEQLITIRCKCCGKIVEDKVIKTN